MTNWPTGYAAKSAANKYNSTDIFYVHLPHPNLPHPLKTKPVFVSLTPAKTTLASGLKCVGPLTRHWRTYLYYGKKTLVYTLKLKHLMLRLEYCGIYRPILWRAIPYSQEFGAIPLLLVWPGQQQPRYWKHKINVCTCLQWVKISTTYAISMLRNNRIYFSYNIWEIGQRNRPSYPANYVINA